MLLYPASYAHGPFAFNGHLTSAGAKDNSAIDNAVVIDDVQSHVAFRDLRDPYHLTQGGQLGRVHKGMRVWQISGRIQVPGSVGKARSGDKVREMRAAFDPAICYRDSPTTDGAYALTFTEDTEDTLTYPTGRIALQTWARPVEHPWVAERKNEERHRPYRVILVAADPRVYEQEEQTLTLTTGAPSGNVVNRGDTAAPLKVTYTMAGAGHASCTLTRAGVAFILNLSGTTNGDSVVVVHETSGPYGRGRYITKNGTESFSLKTSAASTWLDVPVGITSFTLTNTTNITSVVLRWYSARA